MDLFQSSFFSDNNWCSLETSTGTQWNFMATKTHLGTTETFRNY